jgi:hydrogenase maturation protease
VEMYARQQQCPTRCLHSDLVQQDGLCIVTVGNSLRGDDGIASALCENLPESVLSDVCVFNLGPYTNYLSECLNGHKAAIIIDSTCDGLSPGSVSIIDLHALLEGPNLNINSSHGLSVADELKLAKQLGSLPTRLIFFGVEIGAVNWNETISPALKEKLPLLVSNLAFLVQRILETLRKDA